MKSSDKLKRNVFLSNGPVYSLLAIYMPLTLWTAVIFLLRALLRSDMSLLLFIVTGGLGGIAASFYFDFMKDVKSSRAAANTRGGIIIVAAAYGLASLFRSGVPFKEKFSPDFLNIISSAGVLYVWISVIVLKELFSARRHFEVYTEMYQGKKLQSVLYEDSSLLQYTDESITKAAQRYFFQLGFVCLLVFICEFFKIPLPSGLYLFFIVLFLGGILLFGFFEIVKWEHYYAGEGIGLSASDRNKRILAIVTISLLCLAAAVVFASDKSVLSISLITGFFTWLFSFFRRERHIEYERPVFSENQVSREIPQFPSELNDMHVSPVWALISEIIQFILKYGLIFLAVFLFIRFMISPLLNRGRFPESMPFHKRLIFIVTEWFRGIINAFSSFIAHLKDTGTRKKLRKFSTEEIARTADYVKGAYSNAKRKDMRRSVTLFAQLIIWGGEVRGVMWKPSLAPGEYCSILAGAAPLDTPDLQQTNEKIIRCGDIFGKALYSADVLSDAERKEFKELIKAILLLQ